jgi:hypothetical protein
MTRRKYPVKPPATRNETLHEMSIDLIVDAIKHAQFLRSRQTVTELALQLARLTRPPASRSNTHRGRVDAGAAHKKARQA